MSSLLPHDICHGRSVSRRPPTMDLTEAEDIKKRWQEYTEELYNNGRNDADNHDGVVTHLEPDNL